MISGKKNIYEKILKNNLFRYIQNLAVWFNKPDVYINNYDIIWYYYYFCCLTKTRKCRTCLHSQPMGTGKIVTKRRLLPRCCMTC